MAQTQILRHGTYTNGGPATVTPWTLATAGVTGVLGKSPWQWLGWYDLRPWQGEPPGLGAAAYRQNVTAVKTGGARVRFTPAFGGANEAGPAVNPIAIPTAGALANVQLGARCSDGPATWQPGDGTNTTVQAVSLMVVGLDGPNLGNTWSQTAAQTWPQMDTANTPGQTRNIFQNYMSVGPEVLSDLAQGPAATYDVESLGGGARFVGVWAVGYWVGPDLTALQTGAVLNWVVEDCKGPPRCGATTYAFPIRRVANLAAVATSAPVPSRTVAQWSMQRFGNNEVLTGASGGSSQGGGGGCSVVVVNGGVPLNARIDYHVATAVDLTASPAAMQPIAAGTATTPTMARMRNAVGGVATTINPPYSYASLVMTCGVGASPPNLTDTVAMALVTVG